MRKEDLDGELAEVNGNVEHLPDDAFGVGQQREREVAECSF